MSCAEIISSGARQASDKGVPPHQQLSRDQELRALATHLPARQQNPVIFLRLPSGRGVKVSLRYNCYTLGHIQRDMLERTISSNRVFLVIPGCNEPLPRDQDLRNLLPNIRELQVVVC